MQRQVDHVDCPYGNVRCLNVALGYVSISFHYFFFNLAQITVLLSTSGCCLASIEIIYRLSMSRPYRWTLSNVYLHIDLSKCKHLFTRACIEITFL